MWLECGGLRVEFESKSKSGAVAAVVADDVAVDAAGDDDVISDM